MIIGKNTNIGQNKNFVNNQQSNNIANCPSSPTPMIESQTIQHKNIMSKREMNEKAFSMLQDRLNQGLITIDEFNKKCRELGKSK